MGSQTNFWIRWRVRVGYPVALVYLALARPTVLSLAIGGAIGLIGLLIRAWAAGHLRKHQVLATEGPYAFTRNPLYFGSVILAAGFVIAGKSIWAAIVVAAYLGVFYPAVMRKEEAELERHYGTDFKNYAANVPLFWPLPRRAGTSGNSGQKFSRQLYRRNREYQAAIGFVVGLVALWARMRWLP